MPEKLSVLIPVFNEEKNLPECLESVRGMADELGSGERFVESLTRCPPEGTEAAPSTFRTLPARK